MSSSSLTDARQIYMTFLNGFSLTIAMSAVTALADNNHGADLLVLAAALGLLVVLTSKINRAIQAFRKKLTNGSYSNPTQQATDTLDHLALLVDGPFRLVEQLLGFLCSVVVNFLAATIGQWAMSLQAAAIHTMFVTLVIGVSLAWLLGRSCHFYD